MQLAVLKSQLHSIYLHILQADIFLASILSNQQLPQQHPNMGHNRTTNNITSTTKIYIIITISHPQLNSLYHNCTSYNIISMTRQLKNGQYSYLESDQLGKGSFGKVFKGKITQTGEVVAIKAIDMNDLRKFGQQIFQVITTEISVMIKLSRETKKTNFPYIVKIYDCFRTENNIFMILEYCGEGDLEGLLRSRKSIPQRQAIQIIYQISQSLQFLATHQIAHRDLKPQNIFIKKEKIGGKQRTLYKLGDFGFAAQKKTFSTTLGTYPYMAPQLFQQNQYDTAVDIWALGVMSHQILFDQIYFIGKDQFQIKKKVLKNKYQLKISQRQKISKQMQNFLVGCLERDPSKRLNANTIAQHPVFKNLQKQYNQRMNMNNLAHINYVIKILKQNIYKCIFLKMVAMNLKDLVKYSDFGVIYLLKKAKYILTQILQHLRKEKCPFTIQSNIWFDFIKSNDLKDATNYISKQLQQLDHLFAEYLSQFKRYMTKFADSDQEKIHSILTASASSELFCSVYHKQMDRWVQVLSQQKNEAKCILAAECYVALKIDDVTRYDFQTHCKKRREIDINQIKKWLSQK